MTRVFYWALDALGLTLLVALFMGLWLITP